MWIKHSDIYGGRRYMTSARQSIPYHKNTFRRLIMKNTGIVRNIDGLGRIVIPKEIRKAFNINNNDPMQILVNGEDIILRKYDITTNVMDKFKELVRYCEGIGLKVDEEAIENFMMALSEAVGEED